MSKAKVLRRWPKASITSYAGPAWVVYNQEWPINRSLNLGEPTPRQAWAAAAKHPTVRNVKHSRDIGGKG